MEKRVLGNTSIEISPVGLGCMGLSHAFGTPLEKAEAANKIRAAFEMGYTFFDTAECYTGTNPDGTTAYNEEAVGLGIRGIRDKIVLATKCGVAFSDSGMLLDSSPKAIRKAIEGSLRRLQTDYIDLYYQHRVDPKVEPETVAETIGQLIKEGKIRAWGISCVEEDYLRRANSVCPVTAIQNRYSMIAREYEPLFPVLDELDIALVAFSPLGNGFLSGAYTASDKFAEGVDFRSHMPQYTREGFDAGKPLFDYLAQLGKEKNATPGQLSLAWMMCKKPWIIPIPGSRKEERLRENFSSGDVVLTAEEIAKLDSLLDTMNLPAYGRR